MHDNEKILNDLESILRSRVLNKDNLSKQGYEDSIAAFGEEASAKLLADRFGFEYIDPRGLFLFDENRCLLEEESIGMIQKTLKDKSRVIIPGFYGYNEKGEIVAFSRGGSDITGAYIGVAMNAFVYENFTDSPIACVDPRVVSGPKFIDKITYRELRNLTYFGFEILHKDVIKPLMNYNVPVHVRSTLNFLQRGTFVSSTRNSLFDSSSMIGVSCKSGFSSLVFYKYGLNEEIGGLAKLFGVLAKYKINVEHDSTGIDTCSVLVHDSVIKNRFNGFEDLMNLLGRELSNYEISSKSDIDCLVLSGIGLSKSNNVQVGLGVLFDDAGIVFDFVSKSNIEHSMIYKISEGRGEDALKLVHDKYLK